MGDMLNARVEGVIYHTDMSPPPMSGPDDDILSKREKMEAMEDLKGRVRSDPMDTEALYSLGKLQCELEYHTDALETLDELLALEPGDPHAMLWKSRALEALGEVGEAKRVRDRALRLLDRKRAGGDGSHSRAASPGSAATSDERRRKRIIEHRIREARRVSWAEVGIATGCIIMLIIFLNVLAHALGL